MSRRHAAVALALGASLVAGCGSSGAPATDPLSGLRADVRAIATAAAAKQYRQAASALTKLQADIAAAKATGEVSPAKLAAIEAAIAPVAADLAGQLRPTPTPTPTHTTTPTRSAARTTTKPAPRPPAPAPHKRKKHKGDG